MMHSLRIDHPRARQDVWNGVQRLKPLMNCNLQDRGRGIRRAVHGFDAFRVPAATGQFRADARRPTGSMPLLIKSPQIQLTIPWHDRHQEYTPYSMRVRKSSTSSNPIWVVNRSIGARPSRPMAGDVIQFTACWRSPSMSSALLRTLAKRQVLLVCSAVNGSGFLMRRCTVRSDSPMILANT